MRFYGSLLICTLLAIPVLAAESVFPGAVGFGIETPAGRGGKVIRVTTLDASGPGSFREALGTRGPRIIVFEVGGVIDLQMQGLSISEPFVTVAGQTAPDPGITLIRGGLSISTHDVLIQHLSIRPGDAGQPKRSGWEPDGISTSGGDAYNIVVDHCSITWAVDENLSASGSRTEGPDATSHKVTFSHCIIAECLNDSSHAKGPHSKGSLIHDFARDIGIIGNLYAHNDKRNPYFKAFTTGAIVNNVIYNPKRSAIQMTYVEKEFEGTRYTPENGKVSVVGNVLYHGADTAKGLRLVGYRGDAYMQDNVAWDRDNKPIPVATPSIVQLADPPVWPKGLSALPATETTDWVLVNVGSRPARRDPIDARIVDTVRSRSGRLIDSQEEVGGYPTYTPAHRKLEIPPDVDAWLVSLHEALLVD